MDASVSLLARIERLEALEQIRQLPAKYAVSLDMRDWDSLVNLFVEDVKVSGKQRGRQALKKWYDNAVRDNLLATAHVTGNHIIDFEGPDLASGLVYSRNDLESGGKWYIEMMIYLDRYERRRDRWYFQRRTPVFLYQCDIRNPPVGPNKLRWGDKEWQPENFHLGFPSWQEFWDAWDRYADQEVRPEPRLDAFLESLRRGQDTPRVKPNGAQRA